MSAKELPIVDLTPMASGDQLAKARLGAELRAACEHSGFFYVAGHGVPESLIDQVFAASKSFFDQSMADKQRLSKSFSAANRGYEALGGQTLEPGAPPDLKEGF